MSSTSQQVAIKPIAADIPTRKAHFFLKLLLIWVTTLYGILLVVQLMARWLLADRVRVLALINLLTPFYFLPLLVFIPLLLLARLRRFALLAGALLLVGAGMYGPRFFQHASAETRGALLKVLTFNVYQNNTRLDEVIGWLHEQGADLVLLQDFPPDANPTLLNSLLESYPYIFGDGVNYGNNVALSRYPVLSADTFLLEQQSPLQQRFTVDINGQTIAIYNIHIANPIGESPIYDDSTPYVVRLFANYNDRARNRAVRNLIEQLKQETLPYIAAGDFNMSDQAAIYRELAAVAHDGFASAGHGFGLTWPASNVEGFPAFMPPLLRIDYVWHSADFRSVEATVGPTFDSDHLPVLVTVEVLTPESTAVFHDQQG